MTAIPSWGLPPTDAPAGSRLIGPAEGPMVLVALSRLEDYAREAPGARLVVVYRDTDGPLPHVAGLDIVDVLGPDEKDDIVGMFSPEARGAALASDVPGAWVDGLLGPVRALSPDEMPYALDADETAELEDPRVRAGFEEALEARREVRRLVEPSIDVLRRYVAGGLSANKRERVERAVSGSARLQARLQAIRLSEDPRREHGEGDRDVLVLLLDDLARRPMQARGAPGQFSRGGGAAALGAVGGGAVAGLVPEPGTFLDQPLNWAARALGIPFGKDGKERSRRAPSVGEAPAVASASWAEVLRGGEGLTLVSPGLQFTLALRPEGLVVGDVRGAGKVWTPGFLVAIRSGDRELWSGTTSDGVLAIPTSAMAEIGSEGDVEFNVLPKP